MAEIVSGSKPSLLAKPDFFGKKYTALPRFSVSYDYINYHI